MSDNSHNDEIWRKILTGDLTDAMKSRRFLARPLQLKGRAEPLDVRVTRADSLAEVT